MDKTKVELLRCMALSVANAVEPLLADGADANMRNDDGQTSVWLAAFDTAVGLLRVFLTCDDLNLDSRYEAKTAEEWAAITGKPELKSMIVYERIKRQRWSIFRFAWLSASASASVPIWD
jgi:hypothetical protein